MGISMCIVKENFEIQRQNRIFQGNLVQRSQFWQKTDDTLELGNQRELGKGSIYKDEFRV